MVPSSTLWREARALVLRHCAADRLSMSVLPGLHLMHFRWRSQRLVASQFACMALVLQGEKSFEFGGRVLSYGAGEYLLASMDVPAESRIVAASGRAPLLAVAVELDFVEVEDVVRRCEVLPRGAVAPGVEVYKAGGPLVEAVVRLLRLLDTPEHGPALAPLLRQEVLYWLLAGPAGARLAEMCRQGSASSRVAEAAEWIRAHFAEGFLVEELARDVGMSPSALHQHFKEATGMTPIQYQKRLRLHEARRRLVLEPVDVGEASLGVGYQSHSQFTKDYRRYFGRLPKEDVVAYRGRGVAVEAYAPECIG